MVPILVGEQGCGKTTAVEAICPSKEHFVTLDLAAGDAEIARLMRGKLVCELGELKGLSSKDAEHVKAFISKTVDEWIPKYVELPIRYARRGVFIGTSNRRDFLADVTGARRWLPLDVGQCHPDLIARDRDQIWAEAAALFKEQGVIFAEAEQLARAEHGRFEDSDEWEPLIAAYLHGADLFNGKKLRFVTGGQVLLALGIEAAHQTKPLQTRVRNILIKLGCDPKPKWIDGVKTRGYVVPEMEQ
jgi:predicted P-loop ATPase